MNVELKILFNEHSTATTLLLTLQRFSLTPISFTALSNIINIRTSLIVIESSCIILRHLVAHSSENKLIISERIGCQVLLQTIQNSLLIEQQQSSSSKFQLNQYSSNDILIHSIGCLWNCCANNDINKKETLRLNGITIISSVVDKHYIDSPEIMLECSGLLRTLSSVLRSKSLIYKSSNLLSILCKSAIIYIDQLLIIEQLTALFYQFITDSSIIEYKIILIDNSIIEILIQILSQYLYNEIICDDCLGILQLLGELSLSSKYRNLHSKYINKIIDLSNSIAKHFKQNQSVSESNSTQSDNDNNNIMNNNFIIKSNVIKHAEGTRRIWIQGIIDHENKL